MEELSIEKKAKAYDEALERAKKLQKTCDSVAVVGWCEYLFPEIRESEDEKIRKGLIKLVKATQSDELWCEYCVPKVDALAWLEKQDEQKQEINNFDVLPGLYKCVHRMFDGTPDGRLLFEVGNVYKCLSKHDRAEFEVSYGHSVYLEDPVVCKHFIPFEKQDEQKPIIEMKTPGESLDIDSDTYNKIVDECIYGENKPKFKVGDWVVYYRNDSSREVLQVYDIRDGRYYFTDNVHFSWSVKECDEKSHLWTIEDAKPGDVLACENGWACIFKCLNDNLFSSYCFMDGEGWFCEDGGQGHTLDERICGEIHPATKEQCDLLFKKMREAGYEWDTEKKELKLFITNGGDFFESENCEQKPAWSEEDEKFVHGLIRGLSAKRDIHGHTTFSSDCIDITETIDWLKSLKDRVQPQNLVTDEELAQAKKDAYNDALDKIEYHSGEPTFDDGWSAAIWYLKKKNAMPQTQWKPSDEQMEALANALSLAKSCGEESAFDLRTLYEQLKKLRKE